MVKAKARSWYIIPIFLVLVGLGFITTFANARITELRFETDCRRLLKNYNIAAQKLYGGAVPQLFASPPDFSKLDDGDATLIADFVIDNVKDAEGEMQCQKKGPLNTLRFSYEFGAGDFSVTRATLVIRSLLAAISAGNKDWADRQFDRLTADALKSLRTKQIRGDDSGVLFGKGDIDFGPHYAGRLVLTPRQVTFSVGEY